MIAHELGIDDDEVRAWPLSKIRGWVTYLRVHQDLENEAYERAKKLAGR